MRNDPLFWLVLAAMFCVVVILAIGIGAFAKGGEFNRKYGNKLMRARIIAQLIAVVLILLFVTLRSGSG